MAESIQNPDQLVTEYIRIWHEQDFDSLSEVVSESFTYTSPSAGTIVGRENVVEYADTVMSGISDFQLTIHEKLVGEKLVMIEGTLSGIHDGRLGDLPPTDERFEIPRMAKFVITDGKLEEERVYFDQHDFLRQLGLLDE